MGWKGCLIEPFVWASGVTFGRGGIPPEVRPPKEILVLRPNDLGDLLTATPVFEALRRRFADTKIIAGIGSWGRPIIANNPFIDEVIELDAPWNNKFIKDQSGVAAIRFLSSSPQIAALLQRGGFDLGLDLLGSHLGTMLMIRLGVRFRVGIRGYRGGWSACQRFSEYSTKVHVTQAVLNQATLIGASSLPEARPQLFLTGSERAEASALWAPRDGKPRLRLLVGCGGGLPEKCFPAETLGSVLKRLVSARPSNSPELDILLSGGPGDLRRASIITAICGPSVRSTCGMLSLRTTFALSEQADLVITNSSMLLHAAAAFARPTIAVLGGPNADQDAHDLLWGYPPPYSSIGPMPGENWPTAEAVSKALSMAGREKLR